MFPTYLNTHTYDHQIMDKMRTSVNVYYYENWQTVKLKC